MQGFFTLVNAQGVNITGPDILEVGIPGTYNVTASNFSSISEYNYTIKVNDAIVFTEFHGETGTTDDITITMDAGVLPSSNVDITVTVTGKVGSATTSKPATKENVRLNGIGNLHMMAPFSIQKCCTNTRSFRVSNYEDGNIFNWTYPAGWTVVSGGGTYSITLKPDAQTGGNVACVVKRAQASPYYSKSVVRYISRSTPVITASQIPQYHLHRGQSYNYVVEASCGATNYQWSFPTGWSISSGQGTRSVTVSLTSTAVDGNVQVNASYTGGCSATLTKTVDVITSAPPTPTFNLLKNEHDMGWHCDKFNVCPLNGQTINVYSNFSEVETYTYNVSSPWKLNGNSTTVTTTATRVTIKGPSSAPTTGVIKVKATNYLGSSSWRYLTFYRELDYWCDNSYPIYCDCCIPPPSGGGPPHPLLPKPQNLNISPMPGNVLNSANESTDETSKSHYFKTKAEFKIYPNPNKGLFSVQLPLSDYEYTINIYNNKGELVKKINSADNKTQIDLSRQAKGIYYISVCGKEQDYNGKLIIE